MTLGLVLLLVMILWLYRKTALFSGDLSSSIQKWHVTMSGTYCQIVQQKKRSTPIYTQSVLLKCWLDLFQSTWCIGDNLITEDFLFADPWFWSQGSRCKCTQLQWATQKYTELRPLHTSGPQAWSEPTTLGYAPVISRVMTVHQMAHSPASTAP